MNDGDLEERLRTVLRDEADRLPLGVDVERLEAASALRRRSRNVGRFAFLAAGVGIVAFGLAAIGLTGVMPRTSVGGTHEPSVVPTTAEQPSPTASPSAVLGLQPIEPRPGSDVVFEVPPTQTVPGTSHAFTSGGSQTMVTWVTVTCLGPGTDDLPPELLRVTVGEADPHDVVCRPDQSYVTTLPLGEEQRVVISVLPDDAAYTVLAEAVPVPVELPSIEPLDQEPEIDELSPLSRPNWNAQGGGLAKVVIGTLDQGFAQEHTYVCLGPGRMTVEMRAAGTPLAEAPLSAAGVDCIGEPDALQVVVGLEGPLDVAVSVDSRSAWHVLSSSFGDVTEFIPPTLRMTSWVDGQERDGAGQLGEVGCDYSWMIAKSAGTREHGAMECDPAPWPDISAKSPVIAEQGGELRITIEDPWAFAGDVSIAPAYQVAGRRAPTLVRSVDTGEGDFDGLLVPETFGPGSWVIRVDAHGVNGDDTFDASYFFLLNVEP